jgi:uncharacterized membrane protein YphA (DoxX/SURF4 family)
MNFLAKLITPLQRMLDSTRANDFIAPLALRLYLAPVFWMAGMNKLGGIEGVSDWLSGRTETLVTFQSTIQWFGNAEWGLGLPAPALLASLATGTEVIGAILLVFGLGVRWISLPLMATMVVAIVSVHLVNGWQAVADPMSCLFNCADADAAITRLSAAKDLLREHGNYSWLTEQGNFIISNNGIEWATTYFIMLLALFFIGGGKYLSLDYWIRKRYMPEVKI